MNKHLLKVDIDEETTTGPIKSFFRWLLYAFCVKCFKQILDNTTLILHKCIENKFDIASGFETPPTKRCEKAYDEASENLEKKFETKIFHVIAK